MHPDKQQTLWQRTLWQRALWFLSLLVCLFSHGLVEAQSVHPFRTPQAIGLTSQLRAASGFAGSKLQLPLSDWVQTTLVRDQIPVWLDRRIPKDHGLSIEIPKGQSNQEVLDRVADELDAEIAMVDRYIAIVPKGKAPSIEWAYWHLVSEPSDPRLRVTRKDRFEWPDGSDTRSIWKSFLDQYRLGPIGDSQGLAATIDRWPAGRLESTNIAAMATLLLSGFDQRIDWPAAQPPSLQPLLEGRPVRFRYTSEIPKVGKVAWQAWRSRWPQATVEQVESVATAPSQTAAWDILAPVAAHGELVEPLAPAAKPKPVSPGGQTKRYTGRYRGEILKILTSLGQQLSLELLADELTTELSRREVDVSFSEVSLEELLAKLGQASGLKITVEGLAMKVRASDP
ncbi:MAG: hypothetical protein DWH99_14960 [Planctomycetota bacterium]|nr:MAG: hypothetical protein DWH99_14960 [Planctomycetota bacterium]